MTPEEILAKYRSEALAEFEQNKLDAEIRAKAVTDIVVIDTALADLQDELRAVQDRLDAKQAEREAAEAVIRTLDAVPEEETTEEETTETAEEEVAEPVY